MLAIFGFARGTLEQMVQMSDICNSKVVSKIVMLVKPVDDSGTLNTLQIHFTDIFMIILPQSVLYM